ncbi:9253_t:CDS:1 [Ambispora leptoticha]|uniref:9253_t:CDS:1 n=1 Tax=Ambispora leptoticha TaxID=144679 RepID=A0A9N9IEQ1_9GLOM|nr:9253_t:CDS:1 [Ambispora leptoticha]
MCILQEYQKKWYQLKLITEIDKSTYILMDRTFIDTIIFENIYIENPEERKILENIRQQLKEALLSSKPLVIYCKPKLEKLLERHLKRKKEQNLTKDNVNTKYLEEIYFSYERNILEAYPTHIEINNNYENLNDMVRTIISEKPTIRNYKQLEEVDQLPKEINVKEHRRYTVIIPYIIEKIGKGDIMGPKILAAQRTDQCKIYPNQWSYFGGKVEPNETYFEGIIREAQEELNLKIDHLRMQLIMIHNYHSHNQSGTKPLYYHEVETVLETNRVTIPIWLYHLTDREKNSIRNKEPSIQTNFRYLSQKEVQHLCFTLTIHMNKQKLFELLIPYYENEYITKKGKITYDPHRLDQKREYAKEKPLCQIQNRSVTKTPKPLKQ